MLTYWDFSDVVSVQYVLSFAMLRLFSFGCSLRLYCVTFMLLICCGENENVNIYSYWMKLVCDMFNPRLLLLFWSLARLSS